MLLATIMLAIGIAIKLSSKGSVLYRSDRVGKNNKIFQMPKFRSMLIDTPPLATHLLDNPNAYLSPIGGFLRRTSFDEFPQIFSVLKGDMSLVGPRPALFNQNDLIALRTEKGVDKLIPGITGWAQVNGWRGETDTLDKMEKRIEYDLEYIREWSIFLDLKIILMTILKEFNNKNVH